MSRDFQVTIIPAQPDWFIIYKATSGTDEGKVERAVIIGWEVQTHFANDTGRTESTATPIAVSIGDSLGTTGNPEGLERNGWEWETAHLPGGRRHQWEIDAATAKSSNRPPGAISNLTIFKP